MNTITGLSSPIPGIHRFAHEAMATTFEILIAHPDARYAEQAAWAAFDELDQLEKELSRYIENSDISRINRLAAGQPLRIGLPASECLRLCIRVCEETNGAFDITVGSLLDCWLEKGSSGNPPCEDDLNVARQRTGIHLLELDEARHTVRVGKAPVTLDLGGIGKGYAVDRMAALLREWSIEAALIHGGHSSVLALGRPPEKKAWPITLTSPTDPERILARVPLQNRALGASGSRKGKHIINPRTGQPVEGRLAAWCSTSGAALTDALSTAFMVMTPDEVSEYCLRHSDTLAMIVTERRHGQKEGEVVLQYGRWTGFLPGREFL